MRRIFICCLVLATTPGWAQRPWPPLFEVKPWRQLPDRTVSRLARECMKASGAEWHHAEGARLIYHAPSLRLLERVAFEAEWVCDEVDRTLSLPPSTGYGHLYTLDDAEVWQRVLIQSGKRAEGAALHMGRELFFLRAADGPRSYVDIPHEMIHFRLWQTYNHRLPLWLEEGLALHYAWGIAEQYQLRRGLTLYRETEPEAGAESIPWPELFSMTEYPEDTNRMRQFYRQSEALVSALVEQLGPDRIKECLDHMAVPGRTLQDILERMLEWDHTSARLWLNEVEGADDREN